MYIPAKYKISEPKIILQHIQDNSFGLLTSNGEDVPFVTQLPFLVEENGKESWTLISHLARANPHSRVLTDGSMHKVIFAGPHAYISPTWYQNESVPTWNYMTVQVIGKLQILDTEQLYKSLAFVSQKHEQFNKSNFKLEQMSKTGIERRMPRIIGFELEPVEVYCSFKLSQDEPAEDKAGIIRGLQARALGDDLTIAKFMSAFNQPDTK